MQRRLGAAVLIASGYVWHTASGTPDATIRFMDGREGAALDFVLNNSPTARKYLPETMAGGVAAFDYNNDGRLDLFFANGAALPSLEKNAARFSNRLYRNDGGGHFTDVTAEVGLTGSGYSIGAAAGDFDNDGFADLFVAGVNGSRLYRNIGGKRFEDVTEAAGIRAKQWAVGASWVDVDGDGKLDLFVLNYVRWPPAAEQVCHDPSGRYTVYCNPKLFSGTANELYRNAGGGRFEDISQSSGIARSVGKGMGVAVADYDGDGRPDIFVTNDTQPNFLFRNLGNGRFAEVAFDAGVALPDDGNSVSGMGTDFRDYDNDGRPDIVFTALTGQTFPLFRNVGQGQFEDATHRSRLSRLSGKLSGWGVALVDLNNDGWKDLFTANAHVTDNIELFSGDRYREANAVFVNRGDGTFGEATPEPGSAFATPRAHRGAVLADFDGDGRMDAVVTVLGERPEFWRNRTAGGHWIEFKLIGTRSNRDGIGASIRVENAGHASQWNSVTSSVGYASSCLCPVHFGLGDESIVSLVEIRWPDGTRQELRGVKADRQVVVREEIK